MREQKDENPTLDKVTLELVQDRLNEIAQRLARVERLIEKLAPELEGVSETARIIREGFEFYDSMVKLMNRFTRVDRIVTRYEDLKKDNIGRTILQALESSGPMNISQITAAVRTLRGTASRRIIRERVQKLVDKGILKVVIDDKRGKFYGLAEK